MHLEHKNTVRVYGRLLLISLGWNEEYILLLAVDTGRWRSDLILVLVYLIHRQSSLNFSERVMRFISKLQVARHALDLKCAIWLFWPHGARGLCLRGFCCVQFSLSSLTSGHKAREASGCVAQCYSYLSSSTSVVTMSFARPVYVPVSKRGWTRARA